MIKLSKRSLISIYVGAFAAFTALACATYVAYLDFSSEAENLRQLQQEYRHYVGVLKTVAQDSSSSSTLAVDMTADDEKKKPFLAVDRRTAYLKQSLRNYVREKGGELDITEIEKLYDSYQQPRTPITNYRKRSRKKVRPSAKIKRTLVPRHVLINESERVTDFSIKWPIERDKFWISSFFGRRKKANGAWGFHYGIDLASVKGTPVLAASGGKVIEAGMAGGYGNTVVIVHNEKYKTRYAHLNSICVRCGQEVQAGQKIGTVGDTGHIRRRGKDGSHLHLEVYAYGRQINPLLVLA